MKLCKGCNQKLPLSMFNKHTHTSDRCSTYCKECSKEKTRQHRLKNRESIRLKDMERAKNPERKRQLYIANQKKNHNTPGYQAAHSAVNKALSAGKLIRPETCSNCGKPGTIQAHHTDYLKKLDVVWLCIYCHREEHGKLRGIG